MRQGIDLTTVNLACTYLIYYFKLHFKSLVYITYIKTECVSVNGSVSQLTVAVRS